MRSFAICAAGSIAALCAMIWRFAAWSGWESDEYTEPMDLSVRHVAVAAALAFSSYAGPWFIRHRAAHRATRVRARADRSASAWAIACAIAIALIGFTQLPMGSQCGNRPWRPCIWDFTAFFVAGLALAMSHSRWAVRPPSSRRA